MKKGWEVERLGNIARIIYGYTDSASNEEIGPKFLRITDIQDEGVNWDTVPYCKIDPLDFVKYELKTGDIVFARTGATTGKSFLLNNPPKSVFASYLIKVEVKSNDISSKYLYNYFQTQAYWNKINEGVSGSAQGGFNATKLAELKIPITSLNEQERIVSILDQAFATIDQAKENIQHNLQNAKDLFQSELNSIFTSKGEGWIEEKLSVVLKKTETINPLNKPNEEYVYIDVSSVNKETLLIEDTSIIKGLNAPSRARKLVKTNDVIFATVRPTLKRTAIITEVYNNQICSTGYFVLRAAEEIHFRLLFYYLQTSYFQTKMEKLQRGASYPAVTDGDVKEQLIPFPVKKTEQKKIIDRLDALSSETKKLEKKYQQKLDNLEALKKSILQRAFNGELTKTDILVKPAVAVPMLSHTDLHAGIIALSLQLHEAAGAAKTFHHVKSEKIVHLVDYHVGVDLGRNPIKDAAGPNDYPLKMEVERKAKKAGYFTVETAERGIKNYIKGDRFNELIGKTKEAIAGDLAAIESLVNLMTPLNTQEAEVVTTVYAAWNNLLLDKQPITDDAIVTEARENWHESKLKIAREKFFEAIIWLKNNNLVPKGSGKKVLHKQPAN